MLVVEKGSKSNIKPPPPKTLTPTKTRNILYSLSLSHFDQIKSQNACWCYSAKIGLWPLKWATCWVGFVYVFRHKHWLPHNMLQWIHYNKSIKRRTTQSINDNNMPCLVRGTKLRECSKSVNVCDPLVRTHQCSILLHWWVSIAKSHVPVTVVHLQPCIWYDQPLIRCETL